ncbi:MAG TPA: hypothetical protein DCZ69_03040 [Syntrophobacteraceae bacterium]|nr:hypothetical protein [Syntrophobacteraceae bacterium]
MFNTFTGIWHGSECSAFIAILLGESEADTFAVVIGSDPRRLTNASTALKTGIILEAKKGEAASREFDLLLHRTKVDIGPMTAELF